MEQLELPAKKILKISGFLAYGPKDNPMYFVYNGICWMFASISLMEKNEEKFLYHLGNMKKDTAFRLKSFALALYWRSKGQNAYNYVPTQVRNAFENYIIAFITIKKEFAKPKCNNAAHFVQSKGLSIRRQPLLFPHYKFEYRAQKAVVFQKYCGNESEDPTLIGDFKMRAPPVRILI